MSHKRFDIEDEWWTVWVIVAHDKAPLHEISDELLDRYDRALREFRDVQKELRELSEKFWIEEVQSE